MQADALCELARFDEAVLLLNEVIARYPESDWITPAWGRKGDALCAVLAGRFLWTRTGDAARQRGLLAAMGSGALALGGIGFCAGFFGPLLLAPDANQGPLLGLFITGPLGFLLGGIGGLFYWLRHRDKPLP